MSAKQRIQDLLEHGSSGIKLNGPNPWDPQVHNEELYPRIIAEGSIGLGEGYMEGWWDADDLPEFFNRTIKSRMHAKMPFTLSDAILYLKSTFQNRQNKMRAMKVGEIHYDLPAEVWEATLDDKLTGSCAYYRTEDESLDQAQTNKIQMVLDKAGVTEGSTLLDIGVGWGAFAGYALQNYGARPVGVTVSPVQRDYIRKRYGGGIDVRVHDYRDTALASPVDTVISAEMFEHVGKDNHRAFFDVAHRSLKQGGRLVLHSIVGHRPAPHIDPWMNKYIYPEGRLPTMGEIGNAVHGLFRVEDVQDIGTHYDRTLRAWMSNFKSKRDSVKSLGKERLGMDPEMFCRMWEYHYFACAGGFRSRMISVHQYVLTPISNPHSYTR